MDSFCAFRLGALILELVVVMVPYGVSLLDNEAIVEKKRQRGGGRRGGREVWG